MHPRSLNNELDRKRKVLGLSNVRWFERTQFGDRVISPHSFRRSWIVRYLNKYKNPAECSRAIGHSDINTTFAYYQELNKDHLKEFVNDEFI